VIAYYPDSLGWYNNNGNSFTKMPIISSTITKGVHIQCADIDNNGYNDILISNNTTLANIRLFKNLGNGLSWSDITIEDSIPVAVVRSFFEDMDNDSDLDIISCHDLDVKIYTNTGGGNYSVGISIAATGNEYYNMVVQDYTGDGYKDFITHSAHGMQLYINNQNGTYTLTTLSTDLHGLLETCDIDNDGDYDVFYPNVTVFSDVKNDANNGTGTFSNFQSTNFYVGNVQHPALQFSKINNDNYFDAVYKSNILTGLYKNINDGTGHLNSASLIDATYNYVQFYCTDLDNDTDNDIVWFTANTSGQRYLGTFKNGTIVLGINQLEQENILQIFPNPTSENIKIQTNEPIISITIYDALGQIVHTTKERNINMQSFSKGIYFITIVTIENKILTSKIIKE
jgi:hypothetical protein